MIEPVKPEDIRVSDKDREQVQDFLRRAHVEGSLDVTEFDERVGEALRARTRGDLARLIADLPVPDTEPLDFRPRPQAPAPTAGYARPDSKYHRVLRVLTQIWLAVSALNFVVWLLVNVSDFIDGHGLDYPWFLWFTAPLGAALGALWWLAPREQRARG
ncbi:DUF1707 SHOCT-like domain-containing protein [Actinosynnema pretiosum]|uniref:DUF1707 SHOCT-like domain-containing protein n=1 Tax=Actinosynnema pretiosum TaxID=42197 RepID=UPI0012FD5120|nr:DUF1707 domain-containing protein [Actinosynnema pretiosum]